MFRDERGTSAIEFAILAPVMLLLLFGMIAYGIYFGASHSIQQIAADAARTALAGLTPAERSSLASNYIKQNASGYAFINPSDLTISVGDSKADPDQFNVNITYDAHNLPIWNLLGDMQLPGETISRHSTIRIGGNLMGRPRKIPTPPPDSCAPAPATWRHSPPCSPRPCSCSPPRRR